jgi:hypothetical protein
MGKIAKMMYTIACIYCHCALGSNEFENLLSKHPFLIGLAGHGLTKLAKQIA